MSKVDDLRARLERLKERVDGLEYRLSHATDREERSRLTAELNSAKELRETVAETIEATERLDEAQREQFLERRQRAMNAAPATLQSIERHARAFDQAMSAAADALADVEAELAALEPVMAADFRRWFRPRDAIANSPLGKYVGLPRPHGADAQSLQSQHEVLARNTRDEIARLKAEAKQKEAA